MSSRPGIVRVLTARLISAVTLGVVLLLSPAADAATIQSAASGAWNVGSTWVGGIVPQPFDDVIVASPHVVTLNQFESITGLSVNTGGTLDVSSFTLGVTGLLSVSGNVNGMGSLDLTGNNSIDGTGTIAPAVNINGNRSIASGSLSFNATITLAGTTEVSNFASVNAFVITGASGVWTQGMNATLGIAGSFTAGTLNATASGNTVQYYDGGPQTIVATNYFHLELRGSGAKSLAAAVGIGGNLTVADFASFSFPGSMAIAGDFIAGSSTSVSLGSNTISVGGNWSVGGSAVNMTGSTVTFNGGAPKTIFPGTSTFNHVTFSAGSATRTALAAMTIDGSVTIDPTATFAAGSFTHIVGGSWTNNGTFDAGTSNIRFNGATAQIISAGNFHHLSFETPAGTKTISGNLTVTGNLVNAPTNNITVNVGTNTITVAGTVTNDGNIVAGSATLVLNGTAAQGINGESSMTWGTVRLNNPPVVTMSGVFMFVNTLLDLGASVLNTGASYVAINPSASVSRSTGFVEGELRYQSATGMKTFFVGHRSTGYAPVTMTITGTTNMTVTSQPFPPSPRAGNNVLQTHWHIYPSSGGITADLTFSYPQGAVIGTEANYVLAQQPNGGAYSYPGGTIDTAANTAAISAQAIPAFVNWSLGEPQSLAGVPSITSFTPASGPPATSVTIDGANFNSASGVDFNGTPAPFTIVSPSQITTNVPASATSGPIHVVTPGGTATSAGSFMVATPPTISGFTPSAGGEGVDVVITGAAFDTTTLVTFNGTPASFVINSSTQLIATVPPGATSGPIEVTNSSGTANSGAPFTVNGPSSIFSAASGNWNDGATWAGGIPPGDFDSATVQPGHLVILTKSEAAADVVVNGGGGIELAGFTLTATGTLIVDGNITGATGSVALSGPGAIDGTGSVGAAAVTMNGNRLFAIGASLTFGGSVVVMGSTITNDGAVFIKQGLHDPSATWVQGTNAVLVVEGQIDVGTLDATAPGNRVRYAGAGDQTVKPVPYHHLDLAGSGIKTLTGIVTVNGSLLISDSAQATVAGPLTIAGNFQKNGSGTVTLGGNIISVAGDWLSVAPLNAAGSTVRLTGSGPQILTFGGGPMNHLVFTGGDVKTLTAPVTATGSVTIDPGVTLSAGANGIVVGGNWTKNGTFAAGTSTVTFNGAGAQSVSASNFHHVTFQNGGTKTLTGSLTVAGGMIVSAPAPVRAGSFTHTVTGNWFSSSGSFAAESSTFVFNGTGPQTIGGSGIISFFRNVTITNPTPAGINNQIGFSVSGTLDLGSSLVDCSLSAVYLEAGGSIVRTTGYIIGWMVKRGANGTVLFPVGTNAGYSPVTVTVAGPQDVNVRTWPGRHFNAVGPNVLNEYFWVYVGPGGVTADLTFQYFDGAVVGNESNYVIGRDDNGWQYPAGTLDTTANTFSVSNALISFPVRAYTLGEPASLAGVPSISSFSPTSGPAGTLVTINGAAFSGATAVDFNGKPASFTLVSSTQITATVPSGATNGPIHVITPGGTATSAASFAVAATTYTAVANGNWFDPATWSPAGTPGPIDTAIINGFTVTADADVSVGTLNLGAGALTGPGHVMVNDALSWTGGDISGTGTLHIAATANASWSGGLVLSRPATNDGFLSVSGGPVVAGPFVNNGSVDVVSGTMSVGSGTSSGTWHSSGTIRFVGNQTTSGAFTHSGTGSFEFGGGTVTIDGTYSAASTLVTGGNVFFNNLSIPSTTIDGLFTGGTIGGPGQFTIQGSFTWPAPGNAVMSGGGLTTVAPGATLTISSSSCCFAHGLDARTLRNEGTVSWTDAGANSFSLANGAVIDNVGVFAFDGDGQMFAGAGGGSLSNAGLLRKSGGTGTTTIGVPVTSTGTVEVFTGTLALDGGYIQSSGTLTIDGGNVASSSPFRIDGGVVSGSGTIAAAVQNGGTFVPGGSGAYGTLTISGSYVQTSTGVLDVEISGPATFDVLSISGSASLDGQLNVALIGGYSPANGQTFPVSTFASRVGDFAVTNGLAFAGGAFTYMANATDATLTASCTLPVASITAPATICANATGLTASTPAVSGATYTWTVSGGTITSGQNSPSIVFDAGPSGMLTIDVVVSDSCGSGSDSVTRTIEPVPAPAITAPASVCASSTGHTASTAVVSGATYLWTISGGTLTSAADAPTVTFDAGPVGSITLDVTVTSSCGSSSTTAVVAVTAPDTTVTPSGPTTFCDGGSVMLTAPAGMVSYLWSTSENTQSITVFTSGSYDVTVTDTNGCSATSAPTIVTLNAAPAATITPSGPTTFCDGGSVVLTASAGMVSYLWSTGENTQSITVTISGSYDVTVTDTNGCSAMSAPTIVTVNAAPAATITPSGSTTFCDGGSVVLTASAGMASYLWSTGENTQSITVTTSASYDVTVTDTNGCSATSAPTIVTVNAAPAATITPSGPTTFCDGGSVVLTAPAGMASYLWSTGETSPSITVVTGGSYDVTVTDTNGCSAMSAPTVVTVNAAPAATITPSGSTTFCDGGSVVLTASAGMASYLWSSGENTQSITVTTSGSYDVTVTDPNGCSATSAPAVVTVNAVPAATITPSGPTTFCDGGSVVLTAPAGMASYLWSTGENTQSITVTTSGSHDVTVTDTNGCSAASAPTVVTVNAAATATITPSGPTTFCQGGEVSLSAPSGMASYLWSTGATSQVINVNAPGSYSVTVTGASGCSASSAPVVVEVTAGPSVAIEAPATLTIETSTTATATVATSSAATYSWSILGGTITGGQTSSTVAFTSGSGSDLTLSVLVTVDGCTSGASATIPLTGSATCATAPPALLAPVAETVASPATFRWTAVGGAVEYVLWAASPGGAPTPLTSTTSTSATMALPAGSLNWYVTARLSDACTPALLTSSTAQVTIAEGSGCGSTGAPTPVGPSDGASVISPVTFQWSAVEGASYRVWVSLAGGAPQDLGTIGETSLTTTLPPGPISWFVEAVIGGCPPVPSRIVALTVKKENCDDHGTATLIAPASGSTLTVSAVDFRWTPTEGAAGYRVWVAVDDRDPVVVGESIGISLTGTVPAGIITWFAESLFEGCPSTFSSISTFTVPPASNCGAEEPVPMSPAAGAVLTSSTVAFSWSAVPNAVNYELWLAVADGTPALIGTTTGTGLTREVPPGEVDWFIRANVSGCASRDSQSSSFVYEQAAACGSGRPLLIAPAGGTITAPVTFHWSVVSGASGYRLVVQRSDGSVTTLQTAGATLSVDRLPTGVTSWAVEALFGSACSSVRSTEGSFIAVVAPPSCTPLLPPVISAPGQISSDVGYRLAWSPAPAATAYLLQQSSDPGFSNPVSLTLGETTASFLHRNETSVPLLYYYRVRAIDGRCTPPEQSVFSSTFGVTILPETQPIASTESSVLVSQTETIEYTIPLGSELAGRNFTATGTRPWLTVTPGSGVVPAGGVLLRVTADPTALQPGTSLGAVIISTSAPATGRASTHGNHTTTSTPVSVNLVTPVSPTPKSTPPPDALIIPAVAHTDGINAKFKSDVRVTNTSPQVMKYQLTFTPSGGEGIAEGRQSVIQIEPGRTIALDDVLRTWFATGTTNAIGTLEVRPLTQSNSATPSTAVRGLANFVTFASSRTFNATANGTYGQYIPAIPFANFIGRSTDGKPAVLSLQQIAQSDAYRTNLGLVEGSGNPASLLVSVFGEQGTKLTEFGVDLAGGQHMQMGSFLKERGYELKDGRVEVRVTSGSGKVTAYASVLNNQTSDPMLVTPVALGGSGASRFVLPGVAQLSSGVTWQTDTRIFNAGDSPVRATLAFYSMNGGAPRTAQIELAPREVRQLDQTLSTLFGLTNDGGALHIVPEGSANLIASARTFRPSADGGNFGQFIQAVTPAETIGLGHRPLQILQVEQSSRFRSNIGLAEVTGKSVTVEVSVIPPDSKVSARVQVPLAANEFRQLGSFLAAIGLSDTHNARVTVRVIHGEGRVTAYASTIDEITQDPTFVPAQ